ncbi:mucin-13 isoform X1 [Mus musculus]|uniref:mucin-13 isoform X1 n=1 Tax=Mus musculus TaxID=10090 RepID=UPI0003D750BE|nr:mucin-13 isoform X1 [Mus musculus]|eukprot:XP_006521878.1 PREDICTED: mucin-13 isoform X2 [Mus musculus]
MKGFLLLSLSLLLVTVGSSSQASSTTSSSGGTSPPTTVQSQSPGSSSQASTTTSSSGGASPPTTVQSQSPGSSSQASTTTSSSGGASPPTTVQSQSPGSSSQASTTTSSSGGASPPTTVQSQSPGSSSQASTTTSSSGGASPPTTVQSQSPGSSSQASTTTSSSGGASPPTTVQSQSPGSSSQPGPTQPSGGASSSTVPSGGSTGPSDLCNPNPCKGTASCVKLHSKHFCLCLEGYYYNSSLSSCVKGTTFPGDISMSVSETANLEDENSVGYQELYNSVTDFFETTFNKTDYGQTVIIKVSTAPSRSARSAMRDATKDVSVSVVNIFGADTKETEKSVSSAIETAIKTSGNVKDYVSINLCDHYGCVGNDSSKCQDILQCTCKPGLDRLNPQVPFCVAVTCSQPCNAEEKEQCLKMDNGVMDCVCMPGYQRANGNRKCEECPFGYSGMNCKDQFQLILTIVGTIAGALILILLIAFIVSARSKNKKKDGEEQRLIEDDFHNLRLRQTGFSNLGADNSIFPKVRTGVPSQTPNPYANQRSMPRPDY